MRNVGRVFFSTLVTLALAVAVWSLPPTTTHGTAVLALSNNQAAPQEQSVSGKIASLGFSSRRLTGTLIRSVPMIAADPLG